MRGCGRGVVWGLEIIASGKESIGKYWRDFKGFGNREFEIIDGDIRYRLVDLGNMSLKYFIVFRILEVRS